MKKLLLTLLLATTFALSSYSQEGSKIVMIKSVETYGRVTSIKTQFHVIDEKGKTTTTDMQRHNTKGIPINMSVVKNKIDYYLNKGYKLISSTGVSFGHAGVFVIEHTYILKQE